MQIAAGMQGDRGVLSTYNACCVCRQHILVDMQGVQMMALT